MAQTTLNYESRQRSRARRSISATVSVGASTFAVVVAIAANLMIFAGTGVKTMFDGMAMGMVLISVCLPAFIIAAIAAIISTRTKGTRGGLFVLAWFLVAMQGLFWLVFLAGTVIAIAFSRGAPGSGSGGRAGGF